MKWGLLVNPNLEGEEKHLRYCLIGFAQQGNNDPVHLSLKYSQSIRTSKGFTLFSIPWRTCISQWVGHTCKSKGMISLHAMYNLHIHVKYPLAHSWFMIEGVARNWLFWEGPNHLFSPKWRELIWEGVFIEVWAIILRNLQSNLSMVRWSVQ